MAFVTSRSAKNLTFLKTVRLCLVTVLSAFVFLLCRSTFARSSSDTGTYSPELARVAVIGSTGYIGSRLAEALHEYGHSVAGYDRDSAAWALETRYPFVQLQARDIPTRTLRSYDVIIYLGGYTGRAVCEAFPGDAHSENVEDIVHLLKRMERRQLLIFASTSAILEGAGTEPADESWKVEEHLLDGYALSMYEREHQLLGISQSISKSPNMIGFRFGTVIGHSRSQRQEMAYLAFVKSAFTSGQLDVRHPETARTFLWMNDLIRAVQAVIIARPSPRFRIYHLGSFATTIGQVAVEVSSMTGAFVRQHPHSGDDVTGFSLSSEAFKSDFNFEFNGNSNVLVEELITNAPGIIVGREKSDTPRESKRLNSGACGVCGPGTDDNVMTILDLGEQPLANDFKTDVVESTSTKRFPLQLILCRACHHVQLSYIVDRGELFSNYLYRSGTTSTLKEHFVRLAHKIDSAILPPQGRDKRVLEIACNDGSQLNQFKALGWETYGADPAANIVKMAEEQGHRIKVGFWGVDDFSDTLPEELDAIVAQNVLAHVPDPVEFLRSCKQYMTENTRLYIQTSQCDMFETGQFDTTYHEHIHFFTAHSFQSIADLTGMRIENFEIVSIHGRSCLVTFVKKSGAQRLDSLSFTMNQRLSHEKEQGVTEDFYFARFRYRAKNVQQWIHAKLNMFGEEGHEVIGYGAAAKGIVLLHSLLALPDAKYNFAAVIDDEPFKQGRFCPGTAIPVKPSSALSSESLAESSEGTRPLVIVIFAWNFASEIQDKLAVALKDSTRDVKLLIPFPETRLVSMSSPRTETAVVSKMRYVPRPWPLPFFVGRRPVVLYSHVFNEEFLLPFWIRHHASMFDRAYIFDYASTDNTVDIFNALAPSSWKLIPSKNKMFEARLVDQEIMEMEALCDNCWKIALTTTEFFIHEDLRSELAQRDMQMDETKHFQIPTVTMVDKSSKTLLKEVPLPAQRSNFLKEEPGSESFRHLHAFFKGEYKYDIGRHSFVVEKSSSKLELLMDAVILKYKYSPWPEVRDRLTQIGARIPESDVAQRLGFQHTDRKNNATHAEVEYKILGTKETSDVLDVDECDKCTLEALLKHGFCVTCKLKQTFTDLFS
jgi:nucleoside-diphosphate-sugar epimerase/SAM-dependent methyltransferase